MDHIAAIETDLLSAHLPLVEHCARCVSYAGLPRAPGTMLIKTIGAAWVVQLIDPDCARWMTVLGLTLDGTLSTAAELLRSSDPPWVSTPGRRLPGSNGKL